MTIIAGFKCDEGVVLCADTQETISVTKRNVNKLRIEPPYRSFSQHLAGVDVTVAFCGAGDGHFIDMLTDELWDAARPCTSHAAAAVAMKVRVEEVYAKYRGVYQDGCCPHPDILYAIRGNGYCSLYLAAGPTVVEKTGFECGGIGALLSNYIAARMYHKSMTLAQCVTLAAYILLQAKNHVEGCGGESHIAVLENDGGCKLVSTARVEAITRLVQGADLEASKLVLAAASLSTPESRFQSVLVNYGRVMTEARAAVKESLRSEEAASLAIIAGLSAGLSKSPSGIDIDAFEMDDFGQPRVRDKAPPQLGVDDKGFPKA